MDKKQRTTFRLMACVGSVLLLCACGGKELPEDLAAYSLNGEQVASINAALNDEELGTHLAEMEEPEEKEEDGSASSGETEAASSAEEQLAVYRYSKLEGTGDLVSGYVEFLTAEDEGFRVVDDTGVTAEPPAYTKTSGEVLVARQSEQENRLFQIGIVWEETGLQVTLTCPEGEISQPKPEPMTNDDAVGYLKGLSPAKLGLTGSSMQDYQVYPIDGSVQVDGVPCLRLQVYRLHFPENSNDIVGVYLLTGDRQHLYRLENGRVTELDIL